MAEMAYNVTVTNDCFGMIRKISEKETVTPILRVRVEGGGCSGFRYDFSLSKEIENKDIVYEKEGVFVVIDPISIRFLEQSTIGYCNNVLESCFYVNNPNALSSCGCGMSFSYNF